MLLRIAAFCSGVLLVASGLMPWTRDGLSGAYVAGGLGGLLVLGGLVIAGLGLAAPRNRLAKWSMLTLCCMAGLFALWAVGTLRSETGVAFLVMPIAAGLGVWAAFNWLDDAADTDGEPESARTGAG